MTIELGFSSVIGYYSPSDIESIPDSGFKRFLIFHNVMNLAGTCLSPLVGLIRALVAAITLYFYNKKFPAATDPTIKNRQFFLMAEMARGGLEVLGLGTLLGIIDIVVSLNRYQLLCFDTASKSH